MEILLNKLKRAETRAEEAESQTKTLGRAIRAIRAIRVINVIMNR